MKFSIIMATHNAADSLAETLDSILAQTNDDYEVVVVDGKSDDATLNILESYKEKFRGKLRWISEADNGIYDALNKGLGLAKGDWLYIIGSGDVFVDTNVLAEVETRLPNKELAVVYGNVVFKDSGRVYDGRFSKIKLARRNICHQAIFVGRNVYKRLGVFETKYSALADYAFNMRWFNDKEIYHKYINLKVAIYENSGFSSAYIDQDFDNDVDRLITENFPRYVVYLRIWYHLFKRAFKTK